MHDIHNKIRPTQNTLIKWNLAELQEFQKGGGIHPSSLDPMGLYKKTHSLISSIIKLSTFHIKLEM